MKKIGLLIIFQLMLCHSLMANDRKEIDQLIKAYGQAMSASDTASVMKLFADDGVFMPSGLPTTEGWQAVKKAYLHEFEIIDLDVKAITDEVFVGNNIAYARTRSKGLLTILASKEVKVTDNYRALFVFKKEKDMWKISNFMFNFTN